MKILAVETATEACSAALLVDGETLERYRLAPREHTRLILPMIDSLLDEAGIALRDLDAFAFGRGPGSFTGVRIAAGIIQGLALGTGLPVVPVSTLACMAHRTLAQGDFSIVFSALDARMGEVYWGAYQRSRGNLVRLSGEEAVGPANGVHFEGPATGRSAGVGSGWGAYADDLRKALGGYIHWVDPECYPRASSVAILGQEGFRNQQAVPAEKALPVYLRNKVARKKDE